MTKANQVIKELCEREELPQLIAITADDQLRVRRVLEKVYGNAFAQHRSFDAATLKERDWIDIEGDLLSSSLFSSQKIIWIKNGNKLNKKVAERLSTVVANTPPGTSVVISFSKLTKDHPVKKQAQKLKCLVELPKFKKEELTKWTVNELARNGLTKVPRSVVTHIINHGEQIPTHIAQICEHCSLYSNGESFSDQDYERLFLEESELKDYGLLDAIQARKNAQAKLLCTQLLRQGRSPFLLLAMIARSYQQYVRYVGLKKLGKSDDEAANDLKVQPWLFKKLQTNARGQNTHRLHKAFRAIFEADLRLKDKSLGNEAILSELVDRLCA